MSDKRYQGNIISKTPVAPTANSGSSYGTASGVWSLAEAKAFSAAGKWPVPATVPAAPTIGTPTSSASSVVNVVFSANATGGLDITSFTATSNPGSITGTGSSSPITVSGLSDGTAYTFTVTATNPVGTSAASSASSSITPVADPSGDTALFLGGGAPSTYASTTRVDFVGISSLGNAAEWGNLNQAVSTMPGGVGGATRGLVGGGYDSSASNVNDIQYGTILTRGTFSDFGDLSVAWQAVGSCGNTTRGLFTIDFSSTKIEYVTIASTGNSTDFGDRTVNGTAVGGAASTTRGLFFGAYASNYSMSNVIDYVTISSTGNATDFGDLTYAQRNHRGGTSSTRCVMAGGYNDTGLGVNNVIDYVTIASTGNATDFGDISSGSYYNAASNKTRCLWAGQSKTSIQYVTIASTGNTADFGDIFFKYGPAGLSNNHGGI